MRAVTVVPESSQEPRWRLSEYFSFQPPANWNATASFDNLPLRLMAYGRLLFQPPGANDVFLKWQIANWLEGTDEFDVFENVLQERGTPDEDDLNRLYSLLLRIPIDYLSEYKVTVHPGLGPGLIIDYHFGNLGYKGRVIYIPSPTGPCDVQIVSYEGQEPSFSTYLIDALQALETCKQTRPFHLPMAFLVPRPNLSVM